ncbi:MAG: hypothetical protein IPP93_01690 [Chitinophagaceae bacterium]|nr:hypothetical protein [Chitinophagaceae bacterium]
MNDFVFVGVPNYKVGGNLSQGAVKIYQKSNNSSNFLLIQTLTATDGAAGDKFGFSLDATVFAGSCGAAGPYESTYLVVGAPNKSANRGSVYMFRYDWATNQFVSVVNNFFASDATANDNYGYSLAINQQAVQSYFTIIVGAPLKTVSGHSPRAGLIY